MQALGGAQGLWGGWQLLSGLLTLPLSLPWLPRNSIAASAVCVFNVSAISQAFNGPFKYQENSRSAWLPYPNPNPNFQVISGGKGELCQSSPQNCMETS